MALERTRRWPPRQRIVLTEEGKAALTAYSAVVVEARAKGHPRPWLEEQMATWAGGLGVRDADGVLLEELVAATPTVNELARAVESCGQRASDVKAGVDRLYGAGLVQPPSEKPELAPPPADPRRFY